MCLCLCMRMEEIACGQKESDVESTQVYSLWRLQGVSLSSYKAACPPVRTHPDKRTGPYAAQSKEDGSEPVPSIEGQAVPRAQTALAADLGVGKRVREMNARKTR